MGLDNLGKKLKLRVLFQLLTALGDYVQLVFRRMEHELDIS
jgi:hypothetical protein